MKHLIPEDLQFADIHGHELSDYVFGLIDKFGDVDAAINGLLGQIGEMLRLDSITVMEIIDNGHAVRCNYEWCEEGFGGSLGVEIRLINEEYAEWGELYKNDPRGVYEYNSGLGKKLLAGFVSSKSKLKNLMQVPIFNKSKLIGWVNYNSYRSGRTWSNVQLGTIKSVCRILSAYMFGMRNLDESREKIDEMMKSDSVTKLPHYDEFLDIIVQCSEYGGDMDLAVCCADISNFKYINEKFGYSTGDTLLRLFARSVYGFFDRVIACSREYSDNFCFAMKIHPNIETELIEERFREFAEYFEQQAAKMLDDCNIYVNIGIAVMKNDTKNVEEAVGYANVARKWAREEVMASSKIAVFTSSMIEERVRETQIVSELSDALMAHEFHVFFQPKADARTMKIVGAEALVRWIKADGSMVYPDMFIPAFERNGCIVRVDYCVYEQVFKYLRERLDKGLPCVRISMNVSRVHLYTKAFISYIEELMRRYNIPPEYLEFELTESVYIDDLPTIKYTINQIKRMGISISVDDFGSGYSSLEILTKYEFDVLKLDRVFMKEEMTTDDKIIVSTLIDMCKRLGLEVLCEGVENAEQLEFLRSCCCDQIQGYYFSKPIDEEAFTKLLEKSIVTC